ncbi:ImmA/IrrE family metallo-endopeptidase [Cytobacillus kochii]|uniref:ImmA/IrrE family metallo-endopeptidase n=1 Tax=Cytobacillus kochii TaxID=859143 RepID=UPI003F80135A
MFYQKTHLEENIEYWYKSNSILTPSEIDMVMIANLMDIWIHFHKKNSVMVKINDLYSIVLDSRKTKNEQWQDFAHELGHVINHVGIQHNLSKSFRMRQEYQANNFMYHFCVPTFMLLSFDVNNYANINDGVEFVSKTFHVTEEFSKKRLIHFRNQLFQAKVDENHRRQMESRYPKAPPYSQETMKIVEQALYLKARKERMKIRA